MIGVPINSIIIPPTRFRREFDEKKLKELQASIQRIGLLNPITVEQGERLLDGSEEWILRAGERRLRVLQELAKQNIPFKLGDIEYRGGTIPAVNFSELSSLERLEVEVEENTLRTDFTWQERIVALAALHNLRLQHNPKQTITATASEILGRPAVGDQRTVLSDALIIEKHLDDPEVVKAPDAKSALKIIRKKAEIAHRAQLAVNFRPLDNPHTLINQSAETYLPSCPAASFDVILIDPPYGINADNFGSMADTGHSYNDSQETFEAMLKYLPNELARVSKPHAHCYIFCDLRWFAKLELHMVLAGWTTFKTPLIWDKCGTGMLPFPEFGPRRTYESILYAWKGNRRTLVVKNDVIRVPAVKTLLHGAQKPVALYCDLLSRSANPGDRVLDCFGGSGPILVAANNLHLVATYIEQDTAAYNIALQRVAATGFDDGTTMDDGIEISL
jgi:site-specific DNA-methyltransferase (adenine-specific)